MSATWRWCMRVCNGGATMERCLPLSSGVGDFSSPSGVVLFVPSGGGVVLLMIDFCTNSARPGGSLFWKRDPPDPPKSIRGREFRLSLPLNPLSQRPKEGPLRWPLPLETSPGCFPSTGMAPAPYFVTGLGLGRESNAWVVFTPQGHKGQDKRSTRQ